MRALLLVDRDQPKIRQRVDGADIAARAGGTRMAAPGPDGWADVVPDAFDIARIAGQDSQPKMPGRHP